jgi:hypothetical protein
MPQPDYENDLVFPPQEIKSQDDLNAQGRQSDVLIKAIDTCEKLRTQLNIVLNILLRECPQYEGYVRANFPNYFEELDK